MFGSWSTAAVAPAGSEAIGSPCQINPANGETVPFADDQVKAEAEDVNRNDKCIQQLI